MTGRTSTRQKRPLCWFAHATGQGLGRDPLSPCVDFAAWHTPVHATSGGRRGISPAPRRLFISLRSKPPSNPAQDIAQAFGSATPLLIGLRHAHRVGATNVGEVGKNCQGFGNA